jgi:protein-L-isoaspartate(D-aspartate) O-methyltransferase
VHLKNKQLIENKTRLFEQLEQSGLLSVKTLQALAKVDRENYVDDQFTSQVYNDVTLPIPAGQTISQILVVGLMIEALDLNWEDKLLEIGTGSGYQTAVLSKLNRRVFSVERFLELVAEAEKNLKAEANNNYTIIHADGYEGFVSQAPFDKVIISAATQNIPHKLLQQMKVGAIMVLPVGKDGQKQELLKIIKTQNSYTSHSLGFVKFVPMLTGTA